MRASQLGLGLFTRTRNKGLTLTVSLSVCPVWSSRPKEFSFPGRLLCENSLLCRVLLVAEDPAAGKRPGQAQSHCYCPGSAAVPSWHSERGQVEWLGYDGSRFSWVERTTQCYGRPPYFQSGWWNYLQVLLIGISHLWPMKMNQILSLER